jgi:hypothetical protein
MAVSAAGSVVPLVSPTMHPPMGTLTAAMVVTSGRGNGHRSRALAAGGCLRLGGSRGAAREKHETYGRQGGEH